MRPDLNRVFFQLNTHYDVTSVDVVGDFNDWQAGKFSLEDDDGDNVWDGFIDLPSGEYEYKFLINGNEYRLDPNNKLRVNNEGNENSLVLVGEAKLSADAIHTDADIDHFSEQIIYLKAAFNRKKWNNAHLILVIEDMPKTVPGYELYSDEVYSYYIFKFHNGFSIHGFMYYFEFTTSGGKTSYFGKSGLASSEWEVENFEFHNKSKKKEKPFQTPDWVKDAIFYQIFPERFFNGEPSNNPPKVVKPDTPPKADTFYGGDLNGIAQKSNHLKELGINAVYLNPLFKAPSTHKYDTADYREIDPNFGGMVGFDLMKEAFKKSGIRFILDGVFNHSGTEFAPFADVVKNGEKSKFRDWFFIRKFPLIEDGKPNYECWWGFSSLPKLNTDNPDVKKYLMDTALLWLSKGSSGWRLDVPNEIPHPFWKEFRKLLKAQDPESYILGEIWQDGKDWLDGTEFDAVMNYILREACVEFFAKRKSRAEDFANVIGNQFYMCPMQVNFAMYNLLSSHDTGRFFSVAKLNTIRLRLALAFQFTFPGAPSIYYGEEIGMEGGRDPDNRRFMIWDKKKWNADILETYKKLIQLRNDNELLRRGDFRFIFASEMVIGFERFDSENKLVIFINNSDKNIHIDVTQYFGSGDFMDISNDHPLKRKKAYTLYGNEFVILKKVKERPAG